MNNLQLEFLTKLETRFKTNLTRHPSTKWSEVVKLLNEDRLNAGMAMENSGGEVDVVELFEHLYLIDMFKESPVERTNVCYDLDARVNRKKSPPASSASELTRVMGSYLLDEKMYLDLQQLEDLDLKTSVWLLTPSSLRTKGGALFGDKRYGRAFIYHNGADAYYSVRGFRSYIVLK